MYSRDLGVQQDIIRPRHNVKVSMKSTENDMRRE